LSSAETESGKEKSVERSKGGLQSKNEALARFNYLVVTNPDGKIIGILPTTVGMPADDCGFSLLSPTCGDVCRYYRRSDKQKIGEALHLTVPWFQKGV
jgi:hypothetical protein